MFECLKLITISQILKLINIFYPNFCSFCKTEIKSDDNVLCSKCISKIVKINLPICTVCGIPFISNELNNHVCGNCLKIKRYFNIARQYFLYDDPISFLIKDFKYNKNISLRSFLGNELIKCFNENFLNKKYDYIIPVPITKKALVLKGFNHAYEIAKIVSRKTSISIKTDLLIKIKDIEPQAKLKYNDRRERKFDDVFILNDQKKLLNNKNILLVDDVITSFRTANYLSKILKNSGKANEVDVLAIARAALK